MSDDATTTSWRSTRRRLARQSAVLGFAALIAIVGMSGQLVIPGGVDRAQAQSAGPVVAQFNMCGGTDCAGTNVQKTAWIASKVRERKVSVLTLNEVCRSQLNMLIERLSALGRPMRAEFGTVASRSAACEGADYGNAVLTSNTVISVRRLTFNAQQGGQYRRGAICVLVQMRNRVDVCTVHLSAGSAWAGIRDGQMIETAALAAAYSGPVLLMGDLNDYPASDSLDRLYASQYGGGAYGVFLEGGSLRAGQPCRCGVPTRGSSKLDYVFAKRSSFGVGTALAIEAPWSDHHLVVAQPDWL